MVMFGMDSAKLRGINALVDHAISDVNNYDALLVKVIGGSNLADELNVHQTVHYAVYHHQQLLRKLIIPDPDLQTLEALMKDQKECVFG